MQLRLELYQECDIHHWEGTIGLLALKLSHI